MAVEISHLEVFNNIVRFKNILEEQDATGAFSHDRAYPVLFNCKTGDVRFFEKREQGTTLAGWKKGEIHVREQGKRVYLEFLDERQGALQPQELAPFAWRILQETSQALNHMLAQEGLAKDALPEAAALKDLSQIHISVPHHGRIETLPGWQGKLSRMEAEQFLERMEAGSYLLREGDFGTQGLVLHLSEANKMPLKGYLCTILEAHGKVSDVLLLQNGNRWTWYRDNPDLHDAEYEFFHSPESALHKVHHRARYPIKGK
jgi:hypothetical protein